MSSQRSRGGAAAGRGRAAAARPAAGGGRGVFVQKPRNDVWVALLGVALGSLLLGSLFLIIHLWQYDFNLKAAANPPAIAATA